MILIPDNWSLQGIAFSRLHAVLHPTLTVWTAGVPAVWFVQFYSLVGCVHQSSFGASLSFLLVYLSCLAHPAFSFLFYDFVVAFLWPDTVLHLTFTVYGLLLLYCWGSRSLFV